MQELHSANKELPHAKPRPMVAHIESHEYATVSASGNICGISISQSEKALLTTVLN